MGEKSHEATPAPDVYISGVYPCGALGGLSPPFTKGAPKKKKKEKKKEGKEGKKEKHQAQAGPPPRDSGKENSDGGGERGVRAPFFQLCSRAPKLMTHWPLGLRPPGCAMTIGFSKYIIVKIIHHLQGKIFLNHKAWLHSIVCCQF